MTVLAAELTAVEEPTPLLLRPRLLERFDVAARAPLTFVVAPAGYGKTVAVRQWAERSRLPVVSVTLTADDDPCEVARRLRSAAGTSGASTHPCDDIAHLARALRAGGDAVLVLDAFDAPTHAGLADSLRALADRPPPGLHLVVVQRPFQSGLASATRRRRVAAYLDHTDLAFTGDEARRLVQHATGRDLTDAQFDALMARTEGWPIALRLAARELQRSEGFEDALARVTGEHGWMAAYLSQEVMSDLSPRIRRFLVETSVLDRLVGPLCDAVTGQPASDVMLRLLEHRALFVHRLPSDERSWRYHPLLREHLCRELCVTDPGAEHGLLERAAMWHARHADPDAAAAYLTQAEAWPKLIELADAYGRSMFESGRADRVMAWLDAIPTHGPVPPEDVAIRRACLLTMAGRAQLADQVIRRIDVARLPTGKRVVVEGLRAIWAFHHAGPEQAISAADAVLAALDDVADDDLPDIFGMTSRGSLRTIAEGSRARALWYTGAVSASRSAHSALADQPGLYPVWRLRALGALALLEAWAGNLNAALAHAHDTLRLASIAGLRRHPSTTDALLAAAHVHRERDDLASARRFLDQADDVCHRVPFPASIAILAVERALWHLADGNAAAGLDVIEQHRTSGAPPAPPLVEVRLRAAEIRLLLALGRTEHARLLLASHPPTAELAPVAVQAAVACGDLDGARALLDDWPAGDGEPWLGLERRLWTSIVDSQCGPRGRAVGEALALIGEARREGHIRLFLDVGHPAECVLRTMTHRVDDPYVRRLVKGAAIPRTVSSDATSGLSDRELEVVRYLPTPLSNAQVAAHLYVSLNTLKTHLRSIYRKLGVTGRRDAVRRAEELGIA